MVIYTIYKCLNTLTGKVYIGFDSKWPNRVSVHKASYEKQDSKFYRAIKKYGWENFEWSILYQSKEKEYTLSVMENFFIKEYNSFNDGYNSTLGGDGTFGLKFFGESNHFYNKKHKNETREKMRISKIGANNSNFGKNISEEVRKKISNSLKNREFTEEWRNKISDSLKGRTLSEEWKLKISKSLSETKRNYKYLTCPHCNKNGVSFNMTRYHFENCKKRSINGQQSKISTCKKG